MADSTAIEPAHGNASPNQNTRLSTAKKHIQFMIDPKTSPQPTQLRTRAFLRSLRYITVFLFWRIVRYAKYAAIGAIVAAISGTAIGSVASGAAFLIAPTGILGGAGVGLLWAMARFGWNRASHRVRKKNGEVGADPRKDEQDDAGEGEEREAVPLIPKAEPW
ncbi:uncharacterized protein RCC_06635 [Ramularia collo-cygni]|uniref:Uncharacterized protein n=1 Tax=Ramularia collo-cygni TaxID=112498 RepID=A0A2D3V7P6_9PEZI|nr:uncharacterized protein RCC_06635 [Ramularia collo-cygni]CZT20777.1 uncharacterized protein RCC_06635 [Ramularia collo-cygni]